MKIQDVIQNIPILYINLDRAIDRKIKIEKILEDNNLSYTRIKAIDGENLDLNLLKTQYNFRKMTIYEVACVLSHISAIQYAYDNNYENVLIIEDDCSFEYIEYKTISLDDLIKMNDDADIIQLGIICDENIYNTLTNLFSKNDFVKSCYYSIGTVAYLINKNGMVKILNHFEKTKKLKVADEYIYESTNTYLTIPYFTQYSNLFKSDIRDDLLFQNNSKELWDKFIKN